MFRPERDIPETYFKSGNFRDNFIFTNSVKRHICDAKISRLGHDLHISVNDRLRGFYFHETSLRENKTLAKISEFTEFLFTYLVKY